MGDQLADLLVDYNYVTLAQLDAALLLQKEWQVPLTDILTARGVMTPRQMAKALAQQFNLKVIDLLEQPPDTSLLDAEMMHQYVIDEILPWRLNDGIVTVVITRPDPLVLLKAQALHGKDCILAVTTRFDIQWAVQQSFEAEFTAIAVDALANADPDNSAKPTFVKSQIYTPIVFLFVCLLCVSAAPAMTLIILNCLVAVFFLGNFLLKTLLVWRGSADIPAEQIRESQIAEMNDADLPIYTILVPMFRDAHVLPILVSALRKMDYPIAKLDIKLVLEACDIETIEAARSMGLESAFEIIRVPASQPQTKPKACNYALPFARGEYLVIFDAEDKPEPDQLKKVLLTFKRSTPETICIQARLNYFNALENWLTKMFTLDYSLWFDLMLPGLERLKIPIPLGGTSNHFKTDMLRSLHAWDPYNVTEDADLGVRITQKGYRVGIVDSTTFEEANCSIPNWIRQRSRWLKGYMQTWLVHMRHPVRLYRSLGTVGFFGFHFFIGGTVFAAILNPIFWTLLIITTFAPQFDLSTYFPTSVYYISLFNLIIGNATFVYLGMLSPVKRQRYELIPIAPTIIFYWGLMSIAAYKGLWQLIHNPFYWEKTNHGISKSSADEIAKAQNEVLL